MSSALSTSLPYLTSPASPDKMSDSTQTPGDFILRVNSRIDPSQRCLNWRIFAPCPRLGSHTMPPVLWT